MRPKWNKIQSPAYAHDASHERALATRGEDKSNWDTDAGTETAGVKCRDGWSPFQRDGSK